MHEGFVNYNAGTLGTSMVEGRISAGVVVGDGSDIGGGASIMGTLSGGGKQVISIGERCLLGANAGIGISLGDDCVVEAGCYVTAGTKVTLPDRTASRRWSRPRELSGRRQRAVPPQLGHRRRRGGAVAGRGHRAQRGPARQLTDGRAATHRDEPPSVRRRWSARRAWSAASASALLARRRRRCPTPRAARPTVDGRTVDLDHRAGRERRADRRDRRRARAAGPGGHDRARHGVPGVQAPQPRRTATATRSGCSSSGRRRAGARAEQILDPYYATNAFYDALVKIDGYETMGITEAAQEVQRSGFPEAYADHEADARALASALTGNSPGARSAAWSTRRRDEPRRRGRDRADRRGPTPYAASSTRRSATCRSAGSRRAA